MTDKGGFLNWTNLCILVQLLYMEMLETNYLLRDTSSFSILGNRMLGQARPNSITQVMIYNQGRKRTTNIMSQLCIVDFSGYNKSNYWARRPSNT